MYFLHIFRILVKIIISCEGSKMYEKWIKIVHEKKAFAVISTIVCYQIQNLLINITELYTSS